MRWASRAGLFPIPQAGKGKTRLGSKQPASSPSGHFKTVLAAACILVWLSLGVGIIGKDGDPANLMYFGVLAVGIVGALISRFRPLGMARALFAMALAQALVATIALIARLGLPYSGPAEIVLLNGCFVTMFAGIGVAVPARRALARQGIRGNAIIA